MIGVVAIALPLLGGDGVTVLTEVEEGVVVATDEVEGREIVTGVGVVFIGVVVTAEGVTVELEREEGCGEVSAGAKVRPSLVEVAAAAASDGYCWSEG